MTSEKKLETTEEKVHNYKNHRKLLPKGLMVEIDQETSHVLFDNIKDKFVDPRKCKGKKGTIDGYLDIIMYPDLYPIVKFEDGSRSVFFSHNLILREAISSKNELAPIEKPPKKPMPTCPDFEEIERKLKAQQEEETPPPIPQEVETKSEEPTKL